MQLSGDELREFYTGGMLLCQQKYNTGVERIREVMLAGCQGQVCRTLTAADEGLLVGHRILICDRDAKWSTPVRERLREAGIRVVQTPFLAPNANACAERFVRSIKEWIRPLGSRKRHYGDDVGRHEPARVLVLVIVACRDRHLSPRGRPCLCGRRRPCRS